MTTPTVTVIAIDGGSGAGKSSTARALADRLNYLYCDTGAHYRGLTHLLQQANVAYTDEAGIVKTLASWHIDASIVGRNAHLRINNHTIEDYQLRLPTVNNEVSFYAAVPAVRKFLYHFQHSHAELALLNGFHGLVMEGRDIGSNIFPQTPFKYYFTADTKVKIARRAKDNITDVIEQRDHIDSTKGQLHCPADATIIDTTHSTLEEVIENLYKEIATRLAILKK